jgi:hypothetical protein
MAAFESKKTHSYFQLDRITKMSRSSRTLQRVSNHRMSQYVDFCAEYKLSEVVGPYSEVSS